MSETETSWHQFGRTNRESQGLAGDGKVVIWSMGTLVSAVSSLLGRKMELLGMLAGMG